MVRPGGPGVGDGPARPLELFIKGSFGHFSLLVEACAARGVVPNVHEAYLCYCELPL